MQGWQGMGSETPCTRDWTRRWGRGQQGPSGDSCLPRQARFPSGALWPLRGSWVPVQGGCCARQGCPLLWGGLLRDTGLSVVTSHAGQCHSRRTPLDWSHDGQRVLGWEVRTSLRPDGGSASLACSLTFQPGAGGLWQLCRLGHRCQLGGDTELHSHGLQRAPV